MTRPTTNQVHIDRALTNVSIGYTPGGYVATAIFPRVPVQKISDKYFIYTKGDWLRRGAGVRAPGTRAPRADYGLSTGTYSCIERAVAKNVPDEIQANSDAPLNGIVDGTKFVTEQVLLEMEIDVAADAFGTGWSSSATPGILWSNNTSTPLVDVSTGRDAIVAAIGREANKGVIGRGLWRHVSEHEDILDRVRYAAGPESPAVVTVKAVAALFQLNELLVGTAIYNTAAEGVTDSLSYVWGNSLLLAYVTGGPSLMEPSAGYVFTFRDREIRRFYEEQERNTVVEASAHWDHKIVAADAGYLIKTAA